MTPQTVPTAYEHLPQNSMSTYVRYVLLITSCIFFALLASSWATIYRDDAFIYYTYIKNIVEGNGWVFNAGEKVNACTSALYPILVSFLSNLTKYFTALSIPETGYLLGVLCLALAIVVCCSNFSRQNFKLAAYLFPLILLCYPRLRAGVGMESFLVILTITLTIYLYTKRNFSLMSLAAALAVLARPDSLIIVLVLLIDFIIRERKLPSSLYMSIFILALLPWLIFSWSYFGDIIPNTAEAKLTQGSLKNFSHGLAFARHLPVALFIIPKFIVPELILIVLGMYLSWKSKDEFTILLTIWGLSYIFLYSIVLNSPGYPWYFVPLVPVVAVLLTKSISQLIALVGTASQKIKLNPGLISNTLTIVVITFLIARITQLADESSRLTSIKHQDYQQVANWLNQNAKDGSSLASREIGVLGYYYRKGKIIDGLGLIDPKVVENISKTDKSWHIRHYQPDYVLVRNPARKNEKQFLKSDWFKSRYQLIRLAELPRYILYKKI